MALRIMQGDEMMDKLTDAQIKALRILAGTSTKRANMNTVRALYRMTPALAEFRDYPERGLRGIPRITEAGLNYLAALDSKAAAPAQPVAAGYTYPELLDKYFPGEPEEMKQPSITDASPGYSEPAEPGSDAKDEYTRDEEQARLIARIRELEEALEDTRNLTTDAPKNGIGYDQLRMEILTRIANILDGEGAAIDVQMKWNN